jgi:hypothetical protein
MQTGTYMQIHFRFRVFPRIGGQARFVGAAVGKELLFVPAGLRGNLRQKTTRSAAPFYIDAVNSETQAQRLNCVFQW